MGFFAVLPNISRIAISTVASAILYVTPLQIQNDSPANWKVIRYGDVLLMFAEALNENGKTNEALNYLNLVRNRAGLGSFSNLTKDDTREKIYLERRFELHL